jgi:hypothetical protein
MRENNFESVRALLDDLRPESILLHEVQSAVCTSNFARFAELQRRLAQEPDDPSEWQETLEKAK